MKFFALIPARGGSKRIPRKNLEKVGGTSLVERAIEAAQASRIIEAVYVSTEDKEICDVALDAGARVVHRPQYLAEDMTTMDEVVAHFLPAAVLHDEDVVVLLEPTAPLRTHHDINAIAGIMLITSCPAIRIVSVDMTMNCHGWVYRDAGLASAFRVGAFKGCLFPPGTLLLHSGDDRAVDVDEPADLERARALV